MSSAASTGPGTERGPPPPQHIHLTLRGPRVKESESDVSQGTRGPSDSSGHNLSLPLKLPSALHGVLAVGQKQNNHGTGARKPAFKSCLSHELTW